MRMCKKLSKPWAGLAPRERHRARRRAGVSSRFEQARYLARMSKDLDLVRSFYAGVHTFNAFMRGELSAEAYADEVDPQIELLWRDRQTYPDFPQHLHGLAEFLAFCEQYRDGWIDMVQEPLEVADAPGGRVLALIRQSGRGRQSGVPIVIHFFALYTIREGKMRKVEYFRHRADALQVAGLQEG